MVKDVCYIMSQRRNDSSLGKLYKEGNLSEHVQSYITYFSQHYFEFGGQ